MSLFHERMNILYEERTAQAEREGKRYSVRAFAAEAGITRQAMTNYLKPDYKSKHPCLPDLPMFEKLCSTFSVSADWLLGLSDVRTHDTSISAACETTGLSEEAVSVLAAETNFLNTEYPGAFNEMAQTINALLQDEKLLHLIFVYLYDDHKSLKLHMNHEKRIIHTDDIETYKLEDFEALSRITLLDAFRDLRMKLEPDRKKLAEDPYLGITDESREKDVIFENGLKKWLEKLKEAKERNNHSGHTDGEGIEDERTYNPDEEMEDPS